MQNSIKLSLRKLGMTSYELISGVWLQGGPLSNSQLGQQRVPKQRLSVVRQEQAFVGLEVFDECVGCIAILWTKRFCTTSLFNLRFFAVFTRGLCVWITLYVPSESQHTWLSRGCPAPPRAPSQPQLLSPGPSVSREKNRSTQRPVSDLLKHSYALYIFSWT